MSFPTNPRYRTYDEIYNALPMRGSRPGHKRENAQLDGTESGIGRLRTEDRTQTQPLALLGSSLNSQSSLPKLHSPQPMFKRPPYANTNPPAIPNAYDQLENVRPESSCSNVQAFNLPENQKEPNTLRSPSSNLPHTSSSASPVVSTKHSAASVGSKSHSRTERMERLRGLHSKSPVLLHGAGSAPKLASKAGFLTENRTVSNVRSRGNDPWLKRAASKENNANLDSTTGHGPGSKLLVENFLKDRRREMRIIEEAGGPPAFL